MLSILLEDEQGVVASVVTAPAPVTYSRKEYNFLKPVMISEDCTKKELTKFINDARTWLNKTLTEPEKKEPGMVLAVIRSVLDSGWTDILDRTPGIQTMNYEKITQVMLGAFLERHPLDESISDCMRRIHQGDICLIWG